ncbi:MAG: polysaccharide deacetylase family protein [Clostridia bacterium]|nr:polysaccharide deacetylase family protein [Clostridia bacterium]
MKRLLCALLALLLLFSCALADKLPIPDALRFTQETMNRETVRENVYVQRTYPVTANPHVNEEMRGVIDRLTEAARPFLPAGKITIDKSYLRVGASVSRTGQSWMSFLTVANVKHNYEQTHVDFDARVYDIATGRQLVMSDLFAPESDGWQVLADAVRTQLTAYFPQLEADPAALDALCSREALENAPFTLTGGSLRLHYRADALYPERSTLMHVRVLYSAIRPHMTEEAQRQTDNSCYRLIALTFDDGPSHASSVNVVDTLRLYGADATFFLVGNMMAKNHYVLAYEHDAGHVLAYHSYDHYTAGNLTEKVQPEWAKFQLEIAEITGSIPTMVRAPGGYEEPFILADIGLPLIHWSCAAGDGTKNRPYDTADQNTIARNVGGGAQDGAVVLMHDLRRQCHQYLKLVLQRLEQRGFLCVTVEELFDAQGIALEPNAVYYGNK